MMTQKEVLMPRVPTREHARLARWLVAEGETVAQGEVIAEIATPTATLEVEALHEGRLEKILVPAGGAPVEVDTPLAIIAPAALVSSAPGLRHVGATADTHHTVSVPHSVESPASEMMTYRTALRDALAEEMRRDDHVFLIGADVAQNRGAPAVTQGLIDEFGARRVVAVPPLEAAITGFAVGAAYAGLRPVVSFPSWAEGIAGLELLVTSAARIAELSGGALSAPIVLRAPVGGSGNGREDREALAAATLSSMRGLTVLAPATAADAKGLLKAALRHDGPVAILESRVLYEREGLVPLGSDRLVAIGRAAVARAGGDITVVAYGHAVGVAVAAAERSAVRGIDAEIIDLRTVHPLDLETILVSVRKTGRLAVIEPGHRDGPLSAALISSVSETALGALTASPVRLGLADAADDESVGEQAPGEIEIGRVVTLLNATVDGR